MAGSGSGPGTQAVSPMTDPDQLPGIISGLSRQNSVYRRMMAVCDRVAGAAVQGADAAELTRIFAATAGKTVMLLDPEFRPQAQAGSGASPGAIQRWEPGDASIASMLRVLAAERKPLRVPPVPGSALPHGCLATPIMVSEAVLAYLLVLDETVTEADDVDLVITSYAATLFALTLAREQTSLELGRRYQGAILDALVSGHFLDSHDARRKARSLGVADAETYRVAVARVSAHRLVPGHIGDRAPAEEALSRLAGSVRSAAVIRGPELVMLLPEQPDGSTPGRSGGTTTVPELPAGVRLPRPGCDRADGAQPDAGRVPPARTHAGWHRRAGDPVSIGVFPSEVVMTLHRARYGFIVTPNDPLVRTESAEAQPSEVVGDLPAGHGHLPPTAVT